MFCSKNWLRSLIFLSALSIFIIPLCLAASTQNLIYDANGNLVTGDGYYREYNGFNQLWKIYSGNSPNVTNLLEQYEFDPIEDRVLIKWVFTGLTLKETVYYPYKELTVVENSSGTYEYYGSSGF